MKASVIIPVYNEAATVAALVEKVRAVPVDKEIIVVNDGSSDGTREALQPYEGAPDVRVHHSPINLGKGASVRIGFTMVRGDVVIIQDADLELDPNEYPRLIAPIERGEADVVFGSRFKEGKGGDSVSYLGNHEECSILELANKVKAATGSSSPIELVPYEKAYEPGFEDMPRRVPDTGKIKALLGWQPTIGLDRIIRDVVAFEREQGRP